MTTGPVVTLCISGSSTCILTWLRWVVATTSATSAENMTTLSASITRIGLMVVGFSRMISTGIFRKFAPLATVARVRTVVLVGGVWLWCDRVKISV